jgi:hypothetical protein
MTSKTATRKPAKTNIRVYATDEQPMSLTPPVNEPPAELRAAQHAFVEAALHQELPQGLTPDPVVAARETAQMTVKQEREALKAAGYKRCPTHGRLFDRLPDEAKQPVADYEDVSIRPLSEYQKSTSSCRACDHIIAREWRAAHSQPGAGAALREMALARLIARRDQLNQRIAALEAAQAADATAPTALADEA